MSETRELPCKLNQKELDQRRDELASLIDKKNQLEYEKSELSKEYRQRLDEIDRTIGKLASEIRSKSEPRQVEVRREKDLRLGVETVVRVDTGEEVSQRQLEPHERQAELKLYAREGSDDEVVVS